MCSTSFAFTVYFRSGGEAKGLEEILRMQPGHFPVLQWTAVESLDHVGAFAGELHDPGLGGFQTA